jgi:hypothetical protein
VTIERGRDWGRREAVPEETVVVRSDAEAADVVEEARRGGGSAPPIAFVGGDIHRTLGGTGVATPEGIATVVTVDLGVALLDGRRHVFVAHLVARRSWWRGRIVAAMNAQYLGRWDVAPRAHPGDGRLEILDSDLSLGDRWKARSRLVSGTHVPHPGITERRTQSWTTEFARATPIWLDGRQVGTAQKLAVRVETDALTVVI